MAHKWAPAEVAILAEELQKGESRRLVCPACNGGTTRERSFSISKDEKGGVRYLCFRAKCGIKGVIGSAYHHSRDNTQGYKVREFSYEVRDLTYPQQDYFWKNYNIQETQNIYWVPALRAYGHRVFGPRSNQRGWMCRAYEGERFDSAYPSNPTEPFVHWEPGIYGTLGIVVVEDMLSAYKVAESGYWACALLGTSIGYDRAYEIAEYKKGPVHLALDKGTLPLMIKYREKYEPIWGEVKIWSLDKDLKYVDSTRIKKAMMDGDTNFTIDT